MSLRRYYHRHFGYHERFHFAVILTILVVSYVVVPPIARFLDSLGNYDPAAYEPKDAARAEWLQRQAPIGVEGVTWEVVVDLVLFVLVAAVWLTLVPTRAPGRRSRPR